jgi:predicted cobalt transporter CbtA
MSYAELIQRLQALPLAQQAEVFDFVEFLASRQATTAPAAAPAATVAQSPLAEWLNHPLQVPGFTPLSREEANARP